MDYELYLNKLELVKNLKSLNNDMYNDFLGVVKEIAPVLNNRVIMVFEEFTLHDLNHSLRIMKYMENLVPDINSLNELEICLLLYSALLHDIGMAPSSEEIDKIKNDELIYNDIKYSSVLKKFDGDEDRAIQDLIRLVHGSRSSDYIKTNLKDRLVIPNMPSITFSEQVAMICEAHTQDITWVKSNLREYQVKGKCSFNAQFCAVILRMADILDFDSQRTPPSLYKLLSLSDYSKSEWKQHFYIENSEKIKKQENNYKLVEFHGSCNDPFIHRKILGYIDWINAEIENAFNITRNFEDKYKLLIHHKVHNYIESSGYEIADMKFKVSFDQITKLLMGEQLYGDKKFGLRELIQNSIDACNVAREVIQAKKTFADDDYIPKIKVVLDKENNTVTISDNGIGMDLYILSNYFLKLGVSLYRSDEFLMKGYNYKPIGNYGIGFLACFMLSDKVIVKTKHLNNSLRYEVEISKYDEYVCIKNSDEIQDYGTEIILDYKEFFGVWETEKKLNEFLTSQFLTEDVKLFLINNETKTRSEIINKINLDPQKDFINLNEYLIGIEGFININKKLNHIFANNILEVRNYGGWQLYENGHLKSIDSENDLNLLNYLDNYNLEAVSIPIVEDGTDFENVFNYFEDEDNAYESFINKYQPDFVTIIANADDIDEVNEGLLTWNKEIFPGLDVDSLSIYGHDDLASTFVTKINRTLYHLPDTNLFIPLKKESNYYVNPSHSLYVRGVYVANFEMNLPFMIERLMLRKSKINVINEEIIPNVSRKEIPNEDLEEIVKAVYQAILFDIYEKLENYLEKNTVLSYIKHYHGENTRYLKSKYKIMLNT